MAGPKLYRMKDLVGRLGLSPGSIRHLIAHGIFPRPLHPVGRVACWSEDQVTTYLRALEMGILATPPPEEKPKKRPRE